MMINEHISFQSSLSLEEFTKRLGKNMSLKRFQFDYENENNWSWTYDESNIEINISKPFEDGKFQEWDDSTPIGCNFSLSLLLKSEPESVKKMI
ncbi:hypothetical protein ASD24_13340 [Paenibacillus sp. Root52]|uniref:hypothetical protein n=1 Tax=Paenibacillus sp. Root52 TaxID=1736552 RepID=UPI0006FB55C5|nr:hypothetical protein [Paenibacillus sp. Root52]KQY83258.1 hypothetical protein ASD24_13340 [Paenibacillus sp. Root52]